jgi:hypothetical protein
MKKIYTLLLAGFFASLTSSYAQNTPASGTTDAEIGAGYALKVFSFGNGITGAKLFGDGLHWDANCGPGYLQLFGSHIYDNGNNLHFTDGANVMNIHSGDSNSPVTIKFNSYGGTSYFNSGKFGIGNDNPIGHFQVANGPYKTSIGEADGPNLYYGTGYIGFNAARDENHNWVTNHDGFNNGGGVIYTSIFGDMLFAPIATSTNNSTSNFNQNLSDADIKSRVKFSIDHNGLVRAKEIKVETASFPDYVFKPSYELPSLAEVKAYIDKYQHLPEMPSEAEVVKEGVDLGEINKVLVKKVEELTLYLIEKDKQVNTEHLINQDQQVLINQLQKQMTDQNTLLKKIVLQLSGANKKQSFNN